MKFFSLILFVYTNFSFGQIENSLFSMNKDTLVSNEVNYIMTQNGSEIFCGLEKSDILFDYSYFSFASDSINIVKITNKETRNYTIGYLKKVKIEDYFCWIRVLAWNTFNKDNELQRIVFYNEKGDEIQVGLSNIKY